MLYLIHFVGLGCSAVSHHQTLELKQSDRPLIHFLHDLELAGSAPWLLQHLGLLEEVQSCTGLWIEIARAGQRYESLGNCNGSGLCLVGRI